MARPGIELRSLGPLANTLAIMTMSVGRLFANGPGHLGSIAGRVIPKTLKMVLVTSLLSTQQYKVRINGIVEQSRERSSALLNISVLLLLKREPLGHPRLRSPTLFTYLLLQSLLNFPVPCLKILPQRTERNVLIGQHTIQTENWELQSLHATLSFS